MLLVPTNSGRYQSCNVMDFVIIIVVCVKMCRIEKIIIVEWRLGGGRKAKKGKWSWCCIALPPHNNNYLSSPFGLVGFFLSSLLFSPLPVATPQPPEAPPPPP